MRFQCSVAERQVDVGQSCRIVERQPWEGAIARDAKSVDPLQAEIARYFVVLIRGISDCPPSSQCVTGEEGRHAQCDGFRILHLQ